MKSFKKRNNNDKIYYFIVEILFILNCDLINKLNEHEFLLV